MSCCIPRLSWRWRRTCSTPATLRRARSAEELAVLLDDMGDLASVEVAARSATDPTVWLDELAAAGRIRPVELGGETRWVPAEFADEYALAFGGPEGEPPSGHGSDSASTAAESARERILDRYLGRSGPVTVAALRRRYPLPPEWLARQLEARVDQRRLARGRFTPAGSLEADRHDDLAAARARTAPPGEPVGPRAPVDPPDEYVDLAVLEQMHRRTLSVLRHEVRAVPFSVYADFLASWQHLAPADRLGGPGGLRQVLQQLRALPVVGQSWERDVLSLRLARYDPAELESMCQSGELVWVGSGAADPRRARVRFLFRGEGSVFLAPPPPVPGVGAPTSAADVAPGWAGGTDEATVAVYRLLAAEGASFTSDLRAGLGLDEQALEAALVGLVMAGLVTNDSLGALRQLVERGSGLPLAMSPDRATISSVEEQLARRLGERHRHRTLGHRPSRVAMRAADQRVRLRLDAERGVVWPGRWSLVRRLGVMGPPLSDDERSLRLARQLLLRWGVVTRACLEREEGAWEWGPVSHQLQRLEMRGEVRRGYFARGLPGVQFALPEVVERLRTIGARASDVPSRSGLDDSPPVVLSAVDPAMLWGGADPARDEVRSSVGEPLTFARVPSTYVVLLRGRPLVVAEDSGSRITTAADAGGGSLRAALHALSGHLGLANRRIDVHTWNGSPVLASDGRALLESLGFYADPPRMSRDRS